MKEKDKAIELVDKMYDVDSTDDYDEPTMNYKHAKKCALIAVNEIINSIIITDLTTADNQFKYWEKVKKEINLL